ncbi:MAG: hypothetical protein H3C48_14185 [Chitinophagaceae bacterium]|nr:hypothetical protein [Chitinophagaceae bacterium]
MWSEANLIVPQIPFRSSDSTFEAVYFKNPAEKTINLQSHFDQLGDTDPVSVVMPRFDDPYLSPLLQRYQHLISKGEPIKMDSLKSVKHHRDKRSQVISYLTAEDATDYGLDKKIYSYPVNTFIAGNCEENPLVSKESRQNSFRKKHHLSEITVLNPDGRRYVYGLPVYNIMQKEVSFSVSKEKANLNSGLVEYDAGLDNSVNNNKGKDRFYNAEQLPAYAHSFLLTAIVSPDYVDKTGDGITDDDMGDAVKFNYTRIYGQSNPYKWRTPYAPNKATYNEGLKTDTSDDKGSYIYGEKEVWYLHSLESKTMIATFTLDDGQHETDKRKDAFGVLGENGGLNNAQSLRRLKRIDLYSKADFVKNKDKARPIKSVLFEYSYELCPENPSSINNAGKLTLKKIWFTYNGIEKEPGNPNRYPRITTRIWDQKMSPQKRIIRNMM